MMSRLSDDRSRAAIAASIEKRRVDTRGLLFRTLLQACLLVTLALLAVLIISVVTNSTDQLGTRLGDFLSGTLRSQSGDDRLGVHQGIYGSLWIAVIVAVLAFPVGIGAAVYLEEYAPRNRFTEFVEVNIRNLAGVPSVVYGLLGLALLVKGNLFGLDRLTGGSSTVSAGITLAILALPIVVITAGEAVRAVPVELREGAYGVGATKWEMIRTQVLPYAAPGILTGTLLSMARAVGEAAPLILVGAISGRLGNDPGLFDLSALTDQFTALPIVITTWTVQSGRDVGFTAAAASAIVVLLVFVLLMNSAAIGLRNRFEKKRG
ncbi:MAG: phosphate ABC transporter permease PstA [Acidimicrobiaceae bacterium]|nr:phosphate ABC transporter permease PstA [Acidimicrobiaceae bacterium]MDE0515219.1 phosphate ABC transporter permease PstA [Acidimicrobiaceae bacterium]MDE0657083.1 phosphate ABC transporter permease PstA [Acidimicrobiaceae bacterium]MXZ96761.1 phosphate ABC transporter permease PstA [Acidimicrobiaceae bacterium]MYF43087.1 phosphate ABC transporter permease PstA [Acidimicrobiaceae bacterium]